MEQDNTLKNNDVCIKCQHKACPICKDFCDKLVEQEDGTWDICECGGTCTYIEE